MNVQNHIVSKERTRKEQGKNKEEREESLKELLNDHPELCIIDKKGREYFNMIKNRFGYYVLKEPIEEPTPTKRLAGRFKYPEYTLLKLEKMYQNDPFIFKKMKKDLSHISDDIDELKITIEKRIEKTRQELKEILERKIKRNQEIKMIKESKLKRRQEVLERKLKKK